MFWTGRFRLLPAMSTFWLRKRSFFKIRACWTGRQKYSAVSPLVPGKMTWLCAGFCNRTTNGTLTPP